VKLEIGPERLGEEVVDHVVGRVLDALHLVENHLALTLDLFGVEAGLGHDVGQKVDGPHHVLVQHLGVEPGVLVGGEGVGLPPDLVHLLGDFGLTPPLGALEKHVLEEMGEPALGLLLVAATPPDPDAHRDRAHVGHLLRKNGKPVRENFLTKHWKDRKA